MYRILFIDEHQDDIDDFLDYVDKLNDSDKFKIETEFPLQDLEKMIDRIFSLKIDGIVVDYLLNEYKTEVKYNVPYNGVRLVERILEYRENFPCFILTSFDNDAIKESYDVNKVYIKGILHGEEEKTSAKTTFLERVEKQILHYQSKISDAEEELKQLVKKSKKEKLNSKEEMRLNYLDSFLERAVSKPSEIPSQLKESKNLDELHKLIENTDKLLEKYNDTNDD
jgi:hypothetical protein